MDLEWTKSIKSNGYSNLFNNCQTLQFLNKPRKPDFLRLDSVGNSSTSSTNSPTFKEDFISQKVKSNSEDIYNSNCSLQEINNTTEIPAYLFKKTPKSKVCSINNISDPSDMDSQLPHEKIKGFYYRDTWYPICSQTFVNTYPFHCVMPPMFSFGSVHKMKSTDSKFGSYHPTHKTYNNCFSPDFFSCVRPINNSRCRFENPRRSSEHSRANLVPTFVHRFTSANNSVCNQEQLGYSTSLTNKKEPLINASNITQPKAFNSNFNNVSQLTLNLCKSAAGSKSDPNVSACNSNISSYASSTPSVSVCSGNPQSQSGVYTNKSQSQSTMNTNNFFHSVSAMCTGSTKSQGDVCTDLASSQNNKKGQSDMCTASTENQVPMCTNMSQSAVCTDNSCSESTKLIQSQNDKLSGISHSQSTICAHNTLSQKSVCTCASQSQSSPSNLVFTSFTCLVTNSHSSGQSPISNSNDSNIKSFSNCQSVTGQARISYQNSCEKKLEHNAFEMLGKKDCSSSHKRQASLQSQTSYNVRNDTDLDENIYASSPNRHSTSSPLMRFRYLSTSSSDSTNSDLASNEWSQSSKFDFVISFDEHDFTETSESETEILSISPDQCLIENFLSLNPCGLMNPFNSFIGKKKENPSVTKNVSSTEVSPAVSLEHNQNDPELSNDQIPEDENENCNLLDYEPDRLESSCFVSPPSKDQIRAANKLWQIDENCNYESTHRKSYTPKVTFSVERNQTHIVDFWQQDVLDAYRFKQRISDVGAAISYCFASHHRDKIYKKLLEC